MKLVQEAMEDGGEDDANTAEESEATEEGVAAGKDFSGVGLDGCDGAHAGKNHGGIQESIEPGEVFKKMVAGNADTEGREDDPEPDGGAASEACVEKASGQKGLSAVLEHFMTIY